MTQKYHVNQEVEVQFETNSWWRKAKIAQFVVEYPNGARATYNAEQIRPIEEKPMATTHPPLQSSYPGEDRAAATHGGNFNYGMGYGSRRPKPHVYLLVKGIAKVIGDQMDAATRDWWECTMALRALRHANTEAEIEVATRKLEAIVAFNSARLPFANPLAVEEFAEIWQKVKQNDTEPSI